MSDETLRADHVRCARLPNVAPHCDRCRQLWPCRVRLLQLNDELGAALADRAFVEAALREQLALHDSALVNVLTLAQHSFQEAVADRAAHLSAPGKARAEARAETIRMLVDPLCTNLGTPAPDWAALADSGLAEAGGGDRG